MRNSKRIDANSFYESLMEEISHIVRNRLNELSHQTILNATKKTREKLDSIVGPYNSETGKYAIDKTKFKNYLKTIKQPAVRKRLIKMYKEGTLIDFLNLQEHIFATISNIGVEWLRDNTDIPISPEFFDAEGDSWGKFYKNTNRKPTKEEHNFYKFYTSMGTDVDGLTDDEIEYYQESLEKMLKDVHGIDF